MTDYPTPSDYQEAVQVPGAAFADPELQDATPRTNVLGLPQPITGAFAAVFPMTTPAGDTYAVKCFLNDVSKQQARYEAVSAHLDAVELDAMVSFDYQAEGIRVAEDEYPLLKMEWATGSVLNRFVERHLEAPELCRRLAEVWAALMGDLEEADIAHGDLQHGNILVDDSGDELCLRLVDYDTMYVPALDGWRSAEVGHRNYQHPDRTDAEFGPHVDRFSGLAIYVALRACAVRPSLWDRYDTGENLLFQDSDFYDPDASPLFDELLAIDAVAAPTEALRTACYVQPAEVPALEEVRAGRLEPADVSAARARHRPSSRSNRDSFARTFLPGVLFVLLVAVVLVSLGQPVFAGAVAALGFIVGGAWVGRRYRRLSWVRRRRRLKQEEARFSTAIRGLEREVESLKEKRAALLNSIEERRADRLEEVRQEALYDHLKHHFIGEIRDVEGLIHKHVVRLKAANIRTAFEATRDAVKEVSRISDEARARINMWRAALVQKYEDDVPDALSPAQERRLRRFIDHRVKDFDDQIARTQEKIHVQRAERSRITDRLDEIPVVSFWQYLGHLLWLTALPEQIDGPPEPTPRPEPRNDPDPVPEPVGSDRPWWERS